MARLYSNENFPLPVVERLRALGHDVLTTQEAGKADQAVPDEEVLSFAKAENRAVLTFNRRHFFRLHRENAHTQASSPARLTLISRGRRSGFTKPSAGKARWTAN